MHMSSVDDTAFVHRGNQQVSIVKVGAVEGLHEYVQWSQWKCSDKKVNWNKKYVDAWIVVIYSWTKLILNW